MRFTLLIAAISLLSSATGSHLRRRHPHPHPTSPEPAASSAVFEVDPAYAAPTHIPAPHLETPLLGAPNNLTCLTPLVRKPWHALSPAERSAYIAAEVCLFETPSRMDDPTTTNLYTDLVKAHQLLSESVHETGLFLPFHRLHVNAHELLLRSVCGYKGAQPYWDEAFNAGAFSKADLLTASYFGGDGDATGCVPDGPFAKFQLTVGPYHDNVPRCLSRKINDAASAGSQDANVKACLEIESWPEAAACFHDKPHSGGHNGVGGVMADGVASPGDPLYWLHHAWLDRAWGKWQERWGADVKEGTMVEDGVEVTGDAWIDMLGLVEGATVEEIKKIGGGRNCYTYL